MKTCFGENPLDPVIITSLLSTHDSVSERENFNQCNVVPHKAALDDTGLGELFLNLAKVPVGYCPDFQHAPGFDSYGKSMSNSDHM